MSHPKRTPKGLYVSQQSLELERAKDCFLQAASALVTPNKYPAAIAIINAALGIHILSRLDTNGQTKKQIQTLMRSLIPA